MLIAKWRPFFSLTPGSYLRNKCFQLTRSPLPLKSSVCPPTLQLPIYLPRHWAWESMDWSNYNMGPIGWLSCTGQGLSFKYSWSILSASKMSLDEESSLPTSSSEMSSNSESIDPIGELIDPSTIGCLASASIVAWFFILLPRQFCQSWPLCVQCRHFWGNLDIDSSAKHGLDLSKGRPNLLHIGGPQFGSSTRSSLTMAGMGRSYVFLHVAME